MIEIHKKNAQELSNYDAKKPLTGQQFIEAFCDTVDSIMKIIKKHIPKKKYSPKDIRVFAYLILAMGKQLRKTNILSESKNFKKYSNKKIINLFFSKTISKKKYKLKIIDQGYLNYISHYFRQIFQIY